MTEDEFINQYLKPICRLSSTTEKPAAGYRGDALSLTDDAAILTPPPGTDLILSKDLLVEDTHFLPSDDPADIAIKALAVNLSDIAAKGASPAGFLLGLAFPAAPTAEWAQQFTGGLAKMINSHACPLLGGDTCRSGGRLTISITVLGTVKTGRMIRRSTARPGDLIFTSGTLGDAALGLMLRRGDRRCQSWQLSAAEQKELENQYLRPQPRLALAPLIAEYATAAMDLSDGLVKDLPKLCGASRCAARVTLADIPWSPAARSVFRATPSEDEAVSLSHHALAWGDDYELLFTAAPENEIAIVSAAEQAGAAVQKIGNITAADEESATQPVIYVNEANQPVSITADGFDHFPVRRR